MNIYLTFKFRVITVPGSGKIKESIQESQFLLRVLYSSVLSIVKNILTELAAPARVKAFMTQLFGNDSF